MIKVFDPKLSAEIEARLAEIRNEFAITLRSPSVESCYRMVFLPESFTGNRPRQAFNSLNEVLSMIGVDLFSEEHFKSFLIGELGYVSSHPELLYCVVG